MSLAQRARSADTASLLRLGLIGLALLGIIGTTIELVFLEHWDGLTQQIVWPAMLVLCLALLLIVWRPTPTTVWTARALALAVAAIAVVGIWFHVQENLGAGPLDRNFADTWDATSTLEQYWLAVDRSGRACSHPRARSARGVSPSRCCWPPCASPWTTASARSPHHIPLVGATGAASTRDLPTAATVTVSSSPTGWNRFHLLVRSPLAEPHA